MEAIFEGIIPATIVNATLTITRAFPPTSGRDATFEMPANALII